MADGSATFSLKSPTVAEWLEIIAQHRSELLNPVPQMTALLDAVREDVYNQFDEKQREWTPLAAFTVEKKARLDKDPRILHETKEGEGLRLRDAYASAGSVDGRGFLTYTYPIAKPYASELQEGVVDSSPKKDKQVKSGRKKSKFPRSLARESARLDKEFEDIFNRG